MPNKKPKKILIMTATGSYNLGDELILQEEVTFIKTHYGNVDITVFTHDKKSAIVKDEFIHFVSYFPTNILRNPFGNIFFFFKNIWLIARADVLIIGGGGIIFDNEPGVSFISLLYQWWFRIKVARISGTTLLFWGISLEVQKVANKMKLKKLFEPGDFILVRDDRSKWLLDALEVPATQIQDVVFLHNPPNVSNVHIKDKRVGISVRGGFLGENEALIPVIYDYLVAEGYVPIFLVHSTAWEEAQNDAMFIRRVMVGKTYNITKTIQQTLDVYPFLYAVVGMRFHSWVLACVHEIPFISISYGPKSLELAQELEIPHLVISPDDLNFDIFQNIWHTLIDNYEREKRNMVSKHASIRADLIYHLETI